MSQLPSPPLAELEPVAPRPALRLHLLGPVEAWGLGGERVALPRGRKACALLAVLGLAGGRPVPRAWLADLLWSRGDEVLGRSSLRQGLRELQVALAEAAPGLLEAGREHVTLRDAWVDALGLTAAWAAGGVPDDAVLDLAARGMLLAELHGLDPVFDGWLRGERSRLRGQVEELAERRLAAAEAAGGPEALAAAARRLLVLDRAHEGAWRGLMRAQLARGERGLALRAYEDCRSALREALDAAPDAETEALAVAARRGGGVPGLPAAPRPTSRSRRAGARVAVLPPRILGPGIDAYLPSALADELSDALARFRWLFVLSPTTLEGPMQAARDAAALRRDFDLDYVLDGTLMRLAGDGLRLTLRLLDLGEDGEIAWIRRIERQDADAAIALREGIAAEVVARIDPTILLIESRRAARRPASNVDAYDHLLRAIPLLDRIEQAAHSQAGEHLRRALDADPDFAAAHAWYALWHGYYVGQGWNPPGQHAEAIERAGMHAERAILLDPQDALALTLAGHMRAFLLRRLDDAVVLHERALSLNPNLPIAWVFSACASCYLNDPADGLRRLARYKQLAPAHPQGAMLDSSFTLAHAVAGNWDLVVEASDRVLALNPRFTTNLKFRAAALALLGRTAEASAVTRELLRIEPHFTVRLFDTRYPLRDPLARGRIAAGMRLAGIPES